ncbi:MAG: hypothetical protein ACFFG0_24475 [Candidatus Thorarchaeota archaeon]
MNHDRITIGLFGTCDNSTWRLPFIERYEKEGIAYFDPDAGDDWHPGLIEQENYYLKNAEIILFPVLAASLGSGSLAEIGFSVNVVLKNIINGKSQILIVLIDDDCTDTRKTEEEQKRSIKDRKLVKSKLKEHIQFPNINLVEDLDEMLDLSLELYKFISFGEEIQNKLKQRA